MITVDAREGVIMISSSERVVSRGAVLRAVLGDWLALESDAVTCCIIVGMSFTVRGRVPGSCDDSAMAGGDSRVGS